MMKEPQDSNHNQPKKKNNQDQKIINIPLSNLVINSEYQQRIYFDVNEMEELKASIKKNGVLQAIHVWENKDKKGIYEVVDGGRRFEAAKTLELDSIPAIVVKENPVEFSIITNIIRSSYDPFEEALCMKKLKEEGDTQVEIAEKLGRQQSIVSDSLAIANMNSEALAKYKEKLGEIDTSKNEKPLPRTVLIKIAKKDPSKHLELMEEAIQTKMVAKEIGRQKGVKNKSHDQGLLKIADSFNKKVVKIKNFDVLDADTREKMIKELTSMQEKINETLKKLK